MNTINFGHPGGFPLDTDILNSMQETYNRFHGLGQIAGNLSIISGCEETGNTIGPGVVYIDGEILPFLGGIKLENVITEVNTESAQFQNGQSKEIVKRKVARFATPIDKSYKWADFKRIYETKQIPAAFQMLEARIAELELKNAVFIKGGGMVLWNKPYGEIPDGWTEVVDWQGRMPVGWHPSQIEFNELGKMDGQKNKTLIIDEMPRHSHKYNDIYHSEVGGTVSTLDGIGGNGGNAKNRYGYEMVRDTEYSGGEKITEQAKSFSIMNPYRVVYFIEYVGQKTKFETVMPYNLGRITAIKDWTRADLAAWLSESIKG